MSSARYSLRQTPRKKELFDGMVSTPLRKSRKSTFPVDGSDGDAESSTAAENTRPTTATTTAPAPRTRSLRRRGVAKFTEHINDDEPSTPPPEESANGAHSVEKNNIVEEEDRDISTKAETNGNGHSFPDEKTNGANDVSEDLMIDGWKPGMDHRVDNTGFFEFGGSVGVSAMMIGFPLLMWYMWIGATYYDGKLPLRAEGQSYGDFFKHLGNLVYIGAFPSLKAWTMYWTMFVFEGILYLTMPGVYAYGKPLPFEGGKQLKYYCSGFVSLYVTLAVVAVMHFTGLYKASSIIDEFGPLLSVAILSGYLVALIAYFSALARGAQHRMTGYPIYDFFMGAELNPRMFGILDFKMFFEVRLPWYILLLLSISTAVRQYEQYGYVSGEVMFLVMAHYLYANACSKGEELIVTTWDMYYEKWGFMLIFWNMAGVPLSYCHCTIYLANHAPEDYRWNRFLLAGLFASYLFVYWVWDSCNAQKNSFRSMERGTFTKRNTFPQVPWQSIKNPKKIATATGDSILVDGWYGKARKVHYVCDAFFAMSWALITGFNSPFPWFYPVFFCAMIAHRANRDIERCRAKYGEAWKEYERQVPYLFIPGVI